MASPALAPRFSQSAARQGEELAGQPNRSTYLRQTVSSGNEVMGPPWRGRPASEIRLATLPSSPLDSLSFIFGKEEPTELFAYNDLAEAGRTTPLAGVPQKPHSPTSSGASPFSLWPSLSLSCSWITTWPPERELPVRGCSGPRRRSSDPSLGCENTR